MNAGAKTRRIGRVEASHAAIGPGVRGLYKTIRQAFPDFHAIIHWQTAEDEIVTTFKTYYGTHQGTFLGVAPTGRKIRFETVDAMRVHKGKITEHWVLRTCSS